MILQALTRYYEDLLSRGEIAPPGWGPAQHQSTAPGPRTFTPAPTSTTPAIHSSIIS